MSKNIYTIPIDLNDTKVYSADDCCTTILIYGIVYHVLIFYCLYLAKEDT
jgi:hypothetical protein